MADPAFVDTNIFIRYLTGDDPKRAERCRRLIRDLKLNHRQAVTSDAVVSEIVFVLSSKRHFGLSRLQIRRVVSPLLQLNGLRLDNKRTCLRALQLYGQLPIDFTDCMIAAAIEEEHGRKLISYDSDFDRIPSIERIEP